MVNVSRAQSDLSVLRTELDRLTDEHRQLESELAGYERRLYLTYDEQIARKTLQKRKLKTKDRIFALEREMGGDRPN